MKNFHNFCSVIKSYFSFFNKKNIYKVSKKLRILMVLEIILLTAAYVLIVFFYTLNYRLQQNNSIYYLNHSLLLQTTSVLEKLDTASGFPLAHISDRYQDPLLRYLIEKDHDGITQTDFYRIFYNRTNEISIQFPDLESVLLFDTDGNLLDAKTIYNLYMPIKNYSLGSWYQNCWDLAGKVYILNDEEISYLGVRKTTKNIYGTRVLYDHLTLKPICITLIGIRATDIPVTFETGKSFNEQEYALFDSHGQKLIGNMELSLEKDELFAARSGDYYLEREEDGAKYLYHISYTAESGGSYSVIRTPYRLMLFKQLQSTIWILLSGFLLIILNITIFSGIIRSINRPLARMVDMCGEIGRGNFSVRVPCSQTDELSYLTGSLNSMSEKIQQLINEVYIKSITERDLELQMLRSQINPHFLYNTLENMRMSAYTQGYTELSDMCLLLSKVLRYGVTKQSNLVTVKEELTHLQYYTALLQHCFPELQISVCADENIMDYRMIKVIFQPLVENSVNHASKNLQHAIRIQIWGYEEDTDLVFVVSDNGNGMEKEYLEELRKSLNDENDTRYGIGLKNIHRRIHLYYGENYGLVINSAPARGTSVTVRIPKTVTSSNT